MTVPDPVAVVEQRLDPSPGAPIEALGAERLDEEQTAVVQQLLGVIQALATV